MSITVEIPLAVESALHDEATSRGIDVKDLVRELIERAYTPRSTPSRERPFGLCAGAFRVPDDFDAPLPDEILDAFEDK